MGNIDYKKDLENLNSLLDSLDNFDSELSSESLASIKKVFRKALENIFEMNLQLKSIVYNKTDQTDRDIEEITKKLEEITNGLEADQNIDVTSISIISERFDEFRSNNANALVKLENNTNTLTKLQTSIDHFRGNFSSMDRKLDSFIDKIDTLNRDVSNIKSDLSNVKGKVSMNVIGLATSVMAILITLFGIYIKLPSPQVHSPSSTQSLPSKTP